MANKPRTRSAQRKKKYKRALVLSGGGARGAYQVGVWKFLLEMGWKPDLICGTSVGAINAAAIGSGMNLDELINIWKTLERGSIYRISLLKQLLSIFMRRNMQPIMDTEPFKRFLQERYSIQDIRDSTSWPRRPFRFSSPGSMSTACRTVTGAS